MAKRVYSESQVEVLNHLETFRGLRKQDKTLNICSYLLSQGLTFEPGDTRVDNEYSSYLPKKYWIRGIYIQYYFSPKDLSDIAFITVFPDADRKYFECDIALHVAELELKASEAEYRELCRDDEPPEYSRHHEYWGDDNVNWDLE